MKTPMKLAALSLMTLSLGLSASLQAEEQVLNLYSARHYQTDNALFDGFTKKTGIKIKRIEGKDEELIERIKNEGANSPADVLITVDAARLSNAHELGLFQPIASKVLESRIPAHLRTDDWFAFSTRARVIVYAKDRVKADDVQNYADLANPKLKGLVCTRSGSHPYNLSLMASIIAHEGDAKAEAWARGVVANFARAPKGGDTDQVKAVAAGECGVAVSNSYYVARLMRSTKPEDVAVVNKVGVVFPNQQSWGTHMNIAGGAVARHAKNQANAVKFLEYLASPEAQNYFANGNNEWPAAKGLNIDNPALKAMTQGQPFKSETIPISAVGANITKVQQMLDRVGFQ